MNERFYQEGEIMERYSHHVSSIPSAGEILQDILTDLERDGVIFVLPPTPSA